MLLGGHPEMSCDGGKARHFFMMSVGALVCALIYRTLRRINMVTCDPVIGLKATSLT